MTEKKQPGVSQCCRRLRIGANTYYCLRRYRHEGWHDFMVSEADVRAKHTAAARSAPQKSQPRSPKKKR